MRAILNISLPQQMLDSVEEHIEASGKYASTSEFIRHLIRDWQETMLLRELKQSQREVKEGKFKVLKSLKDLR